MTKAARRVLKGLHNLDTDDTQDYQPKASKSNQILMRQGTDWVPISKDPDIGKYVIGRANPNNGYELDDVVVTGEMPRDGWGLPIYDEKGHKRSYDDAGMKENLDWAATHVMYPFLTSVGLTGSGIVGSAANAVGNTAKSVINTAKSSPLLTGAAALALGFAKKFLWLSKLKKAEEVGEAVNLKGARQYISALLENSLSSEQLSTLSKDGNMEEVIEKIREILAHPSGENIIGGSDDVGKLESLGIKPRDAVQLLQTHRMNLIAEAAKGDESAIEQLRNPQQFGSKWPLTTGDLLIELIDERDRLRQVGKWTLEMEERYRASLLSGVGTLVEYDSATFVERMNKIVRALKEIPGSYFYERDMSTNTYPLFLNYLLRNGEAAKGIQGLRLLRSLNYEGDKNPFYKYIRNGKIEVNHHPELGGVRGKQLSNQEIVDLEINPKIKEINRKYHTKLPLATFSKETGAIYVPLIRILFRKGGKLINKKFNVIH